MTELRAYYDDEIVIPAAVGIDIFHYAIHEGIGYSVSEWKDAAGTGGTLGISFLTSTAASSTYLHLLYRVDVEGESTLEIFEGVTMATSTGTDKAPCNRRRYGVIPTSIVAGTAGTAYTTNRYTVDGTVSVAATAIITQKIGAGKDGGAEDASHEFVLKDNTEYLVLVTNNNAQASMTNIALSWFEVPSA